MNKITVLGIGNILLGDEGFGVRVIQELQQAYHFPQNVQILDGGTLGLELVGSLYGTDKLLVVDAVLGRKAPGAIYEFDNNTIKAYFKNKVSLHELGIQDVLAALEILDKPVKEVIIFGVQPAYIELDLELSPFISEQVSPIINKIISTLRSWHIKVYPLNNLQECT